MTDSAAVLRMRAEDSQQDQDSSAVRMLTAETRVGTPGTPVATPGVRELSRSESPAEVQRGEEVTHVRHADDSSFQPPAEDVLREEAGKGGGDAGAGRGRTKDGVAASDAEETCGTLTGYVDSTKYETCVELQLSKQPPLSPVATTRSVSRLEDNSQVSGEQDNGADQTGDFLPIKVGGGEVSPLVKHSESLLKKPLAELPSLNSEVQSWTTEHVRSPNTLSPSELELSRATEQLALGLNNKKSSEEWSAAASAPYPETLLANSNLIHSSQDSLTGLNQEYLTADSSVVEERLSSQPHCSPCLTGEPVNEDSFRGVRLSPGGQRLLASPQPDSVLPTEDAHVLPESETEASTPLRRLLEARRSPGGGEKAGCRLDAAGSAEKEKVAPRSPSAQKGAARAAEMLKKWSSTP